MSILKTFVVLFLLSIFFAMMTYLVINSFFFHVTLEVFYGFTVLYFVYFFTHPYSNEIKQDFEGVPPKPLSEKEKEKWS
jgi:positive regulator of sigma E activity